MPHTTHPPAGLAGLVALRALPALAALACTLLLAACGGSADQPAAAPRQLAIRHAQEQLDAASYHPVLQQIYMGYFGRPADPGGLAFFANHFLQAGAPTSLAEVALAYHSNPAVHELIDNFSSSEESRLLYPGDNRQFISAIYANLFNRAPDSAGADYWVALLDSGTVTRANAALAIMAGARSTDIIIIGNKALVAASFSNALSTDQQLAAYSGMAANAFVRTVLRDVGLSTDPLAFQATVSTTVNVLVAGIPAPAGAPLSWEAPASSWDATDWQ